MSIYSIEHGAHLVDGVEAAVDAPYHAVQRCEVYRDGEGCHHGNNDDKSSKEAPGELPQP